MTFDWLLMSKYYARFNLFHWPSKSWKLIKVLNWNVCLINPLILIIYIAYVCFTRIHVTIYVIKSTVKEYHGYNLYKKFRLLGGGGFISCVQARSRILVHYITMWSVVQSLLMQDSWMDSLWRRALYKNIVNSKVRKLKYLDFFLY